VSLLWQKADSVLISPTAGLFNSESRPGALRRIREEGGFNTLARRRLMAQPLHGQEVSTSALAGSLP
jgi:hypothetical protein